MCQTPINADVNFNNEAFDYHVAEQTDTYWGSMGNALVRVPRTGPSWGGEPDDAAVAQVLESGQWHDTPYTQADIQNGKHTAGDVVTKFGALVLS